jgi:hypothetical protein
MRGSTPTYFYVSNRTSILHIDQALIRLLGFGANNKKKLPTQPRVAQDLSRSNVVTIMGDRRCTLVD